LYKILLYLLTFNHINDSDFKDEKSIDDYVGQKHIIGKRNISRNVEYSMVDPHLGIHS
jgi:hypothetical protein